MAVQPTGTVTLVFTDIEGSTRLLGELGQDGYREALAMHRRIVREVCARHGGYEVDCEGDSFFYAFASAAGAVVAVEQVMRQLEGGPILIRVGVHTGEPGLDLPKYVGMDVHRAARIMGAAHGGQVLLSESTYALVEVEARDLGLHRLKDMSGPQRLYQLGQAEFPPLKTISNTNLPRPASSFVGREREIAEVVSLLQDGARLLTLTGPGGSGKTRLALEAAAELVPEFKAGVFWVGLAPLRDPALVSPSIAQTLGAKVRLAEFIGERELLLLLDNFEQVVEAAPELCSLVEACPNLRLLSTSRELLRVRGEVEYPVLPLANPEAVELFCDRAGALPDETVHSLCRALDNLPLALELAAARASVLSPKQILERLSGRLDLLKGGRDADPRQQTLRATVDWSYELLSAQERRLFARLSVFAGGCTLEAAEQVADADLDTLQSVVDKSLLRHSYDRFWMLETIREYALERLQESGQAEQIRNRHAACFLELAEGNADRFGEPPLELLSAEQPNLRGALGWLAEHGDGERRLRLAVAMARLWLNLGAEGLAQLEGALSAAPAAPKELRRRALLAAARIAMRTGDYARTVSAAREALELSRAAGDEHGAAAALRLTVAGLHLSGDRAAASALLDESLTLARKVGDPLLISMVLMNRGVDARNEGDDARAYELCSEARAILKAQPTRELEEVAAAIAFGSVALELSRHDEAKAAYLESLLLARQLGVEAEVYVALLGLAALATRQGDASQGAELAGAVERILNATGFTPEPWEHHLHKRTLAEVRTSLGDAESAAALARGRALDLDQLIELVSGQAQRDGEAGRSI